jgi:thiamine pyrophosphate-dependent acetolactate synthase large subunit-like protein
LPYYYCHSIADLKRITKKVFTTKGPVIVDCHALENQEIIPSIKSKLLKNGKLVARSLDNMYPYI